MKIDINSYDNHIDKINFTSDDVLEDIKDMSLVFETFYKKEVEDNISLPPFIETFYDFVYDKQRVPKQYEFWLEYKKNEKVKEVIKHPPYEMALRARVFRTYPSLIRDIHFSLYLREKSKNSKVIYNTDLDYKIGIDIVVEYNKMLYGIHLFTNTERANSYREIKYGRHNEIDNIIPVNIPVNLTEENKFNDFYLYGEKELDIIKENLTHSKTI
jgi:hypothetical protein